MEIALYAPEHGYYERIREIGRRGDFFTSVSVGNLFGELLAFQFADWLSQLPGNNRQIVEAGAHNGQLAVDILDGLRANRPAVLENLEYWIIEPSPSRRAWQQETLKEWSQQVRWFEDWRSLPETGIHGVIFSNELLDAMPVQSLRWDAAHKCFRERLVTWSNGQFAWETAACSPALLISSQTAEILPDGFTIEHSPAAIEWWQQAAAALRQGKLIAFDYGMTDDELFRLERGRGTLRSYSAHRASTNVLENPGEQDITAHVNFTALQRTGEAAGLATHALVSQGKFLTEILQRLWKTMSGTYVWDSRKTKQFQTLTHPEHLGHSFRVLVQER